MHATEDHARVLTAVRNILPSEWRETILFKRTETSGHHGNSIALLESRIKDKRASREILERLARDLNILDKEFLHDQAEKHLEKGSFYLRLDKQAAYLNQIKLSSADPIHLRVRFKKHGAVDVKEITRTLGLPE